MLETSVIAIVWRWAKRWYLRPIANSEDTVMTTVIISNAAVDACKIEMPRRLFRIIYDSPTNSVINGMNRPIVIKATTNPNSKVTGGKMQD